jgi:hypothetical protein
VCFLQRRIVRACASLCNITIYAPMIYTVLRIMFWMRAHPLRGEVGGGWALEFSSFLDPGKWHRAHRRVPFEAQNSRNYSNSRNASNSRDESNSKKARNP